MAGRDLFLYAGLAVSTVAILSYGRAFAITVQDSLQVDLGFPTLEPSTVTASSAKARARALVTSLDNTKFGGFFSAGGRSHRDVMAIFQIESAFRPGAINYNDGGAGNHAYGLGQMLGTTATQFGITDPNRLLQVDTAVLATMQYLKWSWDYLSRFNNNSTTHLEWISAYNRGVGNVSKGRLAYAYYMKHIAAKAAV